MFISSQSESEPIVPTVQIARRDVIDNVKEPPDYDSLRLLFVVVLYLFKKMTNLASRFMGNL